MYNKKLINLHQQRRQTMPPEDGHLIFVVWSYSCEFQ